MRVAVTVAALVLIVSGLGFASTVGDDPGLRTQYQNYSAGDTVKVELRAGLRTVGYNLCFAFLGLERLDEVGWESVPIGSPGKYVACPAIQHLLKPFGRATGTAYLPRDLESGTYRITHEVEVADDRVPLESNVFTVR